MEQKDFAGKKLLILGGDTNMYNVVKLAKQKGAYTIVTDWYDSISSPSKLIADEAWDVSWKDIDELSRRCKEIGIDGVITGFSEFIVDSMVQLCSALNLPCYINKEQLELTRDKDAFKKYCQAHGVHTVKEWDINDSNIEFPVIVKPVDRAGSIGINTAYNEEEYRAFLDIALELSPSNHIIVEQYMGGALKFDCYYEIVDHKVSFIGSSDTLMLSIDKGMETKQQGWLFPSSCEEHFKKEFSPTVEKMIESMGFDFGYCTISFFYKDGDFFAFEAGFRFSGEHSYDYQRCTQGNDYMIDMLHYHLGLPLPPRSTNRNNLMMLSYNLYVNTPNEDIIKYVDLGDLASQQSIKTITTYVHAGTQIKKSVPTKVAMCNIVDKDKELISKSISLINESVCIKGIGGKLELFSPKKEL
jgi:biotin carboxylase